LSAKGEKKTYTLAIKLQGLLHASLEGLYAGE
jgi:hypothetical protein